MTGVAADGGERARRFACTSCGRCCDRGPEIELGEATALADTFVTSLLFQMAGLARSAETELMSELFDRLADFEQALSGRHPLLGVSPAVTR